LYAALQPTVFCPGQNDLDDLEPSLEPLPMMDCPGIEFESHGSENAFETDFWSEFSLGIDRGIGEFSGF
jgi:hypothetical protein